MLTLPNKKVSVREVCIYFRPLKMVETKQNNITHTRTPPKCVISTYHDNCKQRGSYHQEFFPLPSFPCQRTTHRPSPIKSHEGAWQGSKTPSLSKPFFLVYSGPKKIWGWGFLFLLSLAVLLTRQYLFPKDNKGHFNT